MRNNNKHIAVLMGGWSVERDISLITGNACADALEAQGFTVTRVDADRRITDRLHEIKPDIAFNALHGRWGEDGCIQGILECLQIPYTHSGVLASALAMHKERAKAVFRDAGLAVADSIVSTRQQIGMAHIMDPPYVIKPICEGSSVGVVIVEAGATHPPDVMSLQGEPDDELMVEKYIPGRELTCAVMGDKVLDVIEVVPAIGFYDYQAKYTKGGSRHDLPADLPQETYIAAQKMAQQAHNVLGCKGVSRTDLRYDDTEQNPGRLYILETNTQPGMTETSLVPELAAHIGMSFEELAYWLVEDASCDR